MCSSVEDNVHRGSARLRVAHLAIEEHELHAVHQVMLVIRLEDEVVRATLQSPNHIARIGEGGDEDDRHVVEADVGLEATAQLVPVHLWHDHVADHQVRLVPLCGVERQMPVGGVRDLVALLLEDVLELLRLRGTVFHDQNVDAIVGLSAGAAHHASSFPGVEHIAHLAGQRLDRVRLLQKGGTGSQHAVADDGIVGVAGCVERLHRWV